ncbi:MAG: 2-amino-4-hydroxy-6-hydroxymethyldihydropteridine diphosphokinase [Bacteroidales bacterium]|nr:2-amino-4-hydroxy-6-hydroxymethyldihydropteridine diphosphokinase [Bacteroidales bacterium]MCF8389063.1 2-amino-4-hydroxy-6-hydroxymethyldihydropteridine diphosphokinase [Bacteroidales bacterium]
MKDTLVFLLLGTNLGDRKQNLQHAITEIQKGDISSLRISSVYKSEPWGYESENYFLNQAISFYSNQSPQELLLRIKQIEVEIGRIHSHSLGYEDRILDIDILFYGEEIMDTEKLIIPHPRIAERKFTLLPLTELASELIHPVLGKKISELLRKCTDKSEVSKYV